MRGAGRRACRSEDRRRPCRRLPHTSARMAEPRRHPSLFEPGTLLFGAGLALLGAIIGMELLTRVGISANSSIIAAVIAIAAGRIPLALTRRFRSTARQNLLQTVISAATFGGANAVLLPAGMVWLFGRPDLVPVMILGAVLGALLDFALLYRLFGSRVFPAEGLWPSGIATAECLRAGDEGGRRAMLLVTGGSRRRSRAAGRHPHRHRGGLLDREPGGPPDVRGGAPGPRLRAARCSGWTSPPSTPRTGSCSARERWRSGRWPGRSAAGTGTAGPAIAGRRTPARALHVREGVLRLRGGGRPRRRPRRAG